MSFGKNLQFLRRMHNAMTQEELAEKMGVSRQTVSKWELDAAYPEIEKVFELCEFFSCTMDQLLREDMNVIREAFSNIRIEEVPAFRYVQYAVISEEPEDDAIFHMRNWAESQGIDKPQIIGWDFPFLSQKQINVFHMHGYTAACILPEGIEITKGNLQAIDQKSQKYAAITIKEPFTNPFSTIPNAYKTLMSYMRVNGIDHKESKEAIDCYEKTYYTNDGTCYMDVYIAADL